MPEPLQGVHDADSGLRADEIDEARDEEGDVHGAVEYWSGCGMLSWIQHSTTPALHLRLSGMVKK
jgi:hypothetical protein